MTKVVTSDNKITYWQHEAWHTLIGLKKNTAHVTQDINMGIIEEFGSYEVALDRLQMYGILRTELMQHKGILLSKSELLEWIAVYRKQHGIYWVGDLVVTNDPASKGHVYKIESAHNGYYKLRRTEGIRYCKEWRIERHATDKEIKDISSDF